MAVAVLRVEGGLDYSKILSDGEEPRQNGNIPQVPSAVGMSTAGSFNRTRQNSQESLSIPHNQSFSQLSTGKIYFPMPQIYSNFFSLKDIICFGAWSQFYEHFLLFSYLFLLNLFFVYLVTAERSNCFVLAGLHSISLFLLYLCPSRALVSGNG